VKGVAKTELAAWIAACELHPDAPVRFNGFEKNGKLKQGRPVTDPYIPLVAYTEEQSGELCYGALKAILENSSLVNDFDIGLDRIMRAKGDGKAVSLSSSPSARDGARTTFCVMDETHWWTLPRLIQAHQTMVNNLAKRRLSEPWMLEITTAPEPGAGSVAEQTMEYAEAVDAGQIKDAQLFYFHRQAADEYDFKPDTKAKYNLNNPEVRLKAVVEAAGGAASWRDNEAIVNLATDPSADLNFWCRVWLNQKRVATRKAFDVVLFKSLKRPSPVKDGDDITLGFDGAVRHDATALVGTHVATGFQWPLGIWEIPYSQEKLPRDKRTWEVPTSEVDDLVHATFARYNVLRMYGDPPFWQSWLAKWAGEYGTDRVVEWWTNRRKPMSFALEAFDSAIKERTLSHDGNERFASHIGNAHKHQLNERDEEGKSLYLIEKERPDSPHKIDIAMAAVLSNEARNDAIAAGALSEDDYSVTVI
jgi:phage terminase large subunit-like protein